MERVFQQVQLLGVETSTKINDLFRQKVQLEDQLKDVEAQIHYARGVLDAVGQTQTAIKEIQKQDADRAKIEEMMNQGNGHREEGTIGAPGMPNGVPQGGMNVR